MIKINLATGKRPAAEADPKGGGLGGLKGLKLDKDSFADLPLRRIGVALGLALVARYALQNYQETTLAEVQVRVDASLQRMNQLRELSSKVNQVLQIKGQIEQDEFILKTKLETIRKLVAERDVPPKMLVSLAESLPEKLWISQFQIIGGKAQINGQASDFESVSDFIRRLKDSVFFTEVELKEANAARLPSGAEVTVYQIVASVTQGGV